MNTDATLGDDLVSGRHVICTVFYLDPRAGPVRWRPDGHLVTMRPLTPAAELYPGAVITIVGNGNVLNTRFVAADGSVGGIVHAYHFDQVDIVGFDPRGGGAQEGTAVAEAIAHQTDKLDEVLMELQRIRSGLELTVEKEFPIINHR